MNEEVKVVSVLICVVAHVTNQRQAKLFERTLESLMGLNTTAHLTANILVIDNASTIPLNTLISGRASTLMTLVSRRENNLGAARSQAMQAAMAGQHEWIAFVDADIELPIEWLMVLDEELRTKPMRDAIAIATVTRSPHESDFLRALDFFLGTESQHWDSNPVIQLPASSNQGITKRKVTYLPTCAVLMHTKALYHVGGFDPSFSRVGEDIELSYRLKTTGSMWLLSAPAVLHRQDRSTGDWATRVFRHGWGHIDVARKHPEHLKTKKALPLVLGLLAVLALFMMFFGVTAPAKVLLVCYVGFMAAPILLRGISEGRMDTAFQACWIAMVTHTALAAGMWAGLLRICQNPLVIPQADGR